MTDHYYVSPKDTPDFVARHDADWEPASITRQMGYRRSRIKDAIADIRERPENLRSISGDAFELAAFAHLLTPDTPDLWNFLRLSARAAAADGARQSPGAGPVTVDLGSGPMQVPRREPYPSAGVEVGDLCQAYHAALATRDRHALDLLARCDMKRLMRSPAQLAQELISYPYALGLQTMLRGSDADSKAGTQLLIDAMKGCNDGRLDPRIADFAVFILSPAIELALRHLHTDALSVSRGWTPVDEVLRRALTQHRHYWRDVPSDGEAQNRKPESFIALGPLAFAALRHDAGLPVTVRSDYLPQSIVEGRMPQAVAGGGLSLDSLG
jgi:Immunity protein 49